MDEKHYTDYIPHECLMNELYAQVDAQVGAQVGTKNWWLARHLKNPGMWLSSC